MVDISRSNVKLTDLNAYLKFVSKDTISAAKAANINLVDLDGKAITTEGWYDFTRKQNSSGQYVGDGARFIVDGLLIKAIELTLTDNAFGDNDMRVDQIYDPGTPVLKSTTITASDTPGLLVNVNSLTTTELGKSDTYTVALMTKPTSNVTVKMTGLDTTEGSLSSSSLSFT
ncbi:MAG: hypothetical protein EBR59_07360 [Methylococcaceae bacterium]|nr:hypothetical protein [Methylococcaceae bacterium]